MRIERNHMPARLRPAAVILALLVSVPALVGQEPPPEPDPFEAAAQEFGQLLPAEAPASSPAPGAPFPGVSASGGASGGATASYLVGGSAVVDATAYLADGAEGYAASSGASGKVFAKASLPDYGSLFVSYAFSQAFFRAQAGGTPAGLVDAADLAAPRLSLAELHYSFDLGKLVFFRVGKQLLAWGPGRIWAPADFVNQSRADAFAALDLRSGKAGLRIHYPGPGFNAFVFADFSGTVANGTVQDPLKAVPLAARLDATLGGFEFGLSGRAGGGRGPRLGLDFSGYALGSSLYGEAGLEPDSDPELQATLGFSRSFGDRRNWSLSAEGFYNSAGVDLTGNQASLATATPLYSSTWYAYGALKGSDFPAAGLDVTASGLANLTDGSYRLRLGLDADLPGAPPFTLALSSFGGGELKEFTLRSGDRSFALGLQTRIEF